MNTDIVMNNNTTEATATPSVAVKVIKGDEMRRFNFEGKSFQEIKTTIAEIFGMVDTEFTLQYEDDEKDRVTLSSDAELKEAIQLHKYVLRFYVVVTKPAAGSNTPLPPFPLHPLPPHHHHRRGEHPHPPHHRRHHEMAVVDGQVPPPPHHGHHSPYGRPLCPAGYGRHHGHGPHGHHKRRLDKEDKEVMKAEKKRWKKYRKCESSSSSEDEAHKLQKKEMKQLMRATKQSIKANWAPVKEANPAQWPENRAVMIAEIKMAKRIIREQANKSTTPVAAAVTEQNAPVVTAGAEMQA